MRKHGWQLPYHPLQVVAIAVFLALGFAFYVFFAPFVGRKLFEYVIIGLYTPLVTCVFCLYAWCAAADPGDPGIFKSKKYLNIEDNGKQTHPKISRQGAELISSINEAHAATATGVKPLDMDHTDDTGGKSSDRPEKKKTSSCRMHVLMVLFSWCPLSFVCGQHHSHEHSSEWQTSEDGMFYCTLCEVEVFKYSKHCRVCDKCVDGFDHHCRWLNNCIGRRNYRRFFILMVSALVLLILQWSIGVLVLILSFIERKRFSGEIASKLGSSFSLVPYVVVVGFCTFLAMVATLPLAQLFFFHVLLLKKGISTYDYIIALREQEQQGVGGQQSPQMSPLSSITGISSVSSFSTLHRAALCTPPRFFLEDQFDVVPPEISMSTTSASKKMVTEESARKRNAANVKISPWTLARLNAEEVSKAAAQARKKSKILQPIGRQEMPLGQETDTSFGSGSNRKVIKADNWRKANKRGRMSIGIPLEPPAKIFASATKSNCSDLALETSSNFAPLQLEARNAFQTSQAMSSTGMVASSPDSSLGSPDLRLLHVFSSAAEDAQGPKSFSACAAIHKGIQLSRSTSDGYEASGGEDSDQVPSRIVHRSVNWSNLIFNSDQGYMEDKLKVSSLASLQSDKQLL
ncbi:probable protein S-acyltransferase 22 [Elaeis guineensis]|uniref:S-acyltransferase n=1 Tax=Elaeis guineensis var. tenera TaxID=51953 RepID=A0A6I9RCB8_ELAGV|nr:probable protein S-acyltransferase 22 [Elaeis guineensis]